MIENKNIHPPRWAIQLLEWFCSDRLIEAVLGDLVEQFEENKQLHSPVIAKFLFIWNVVRLIHPTIISKNNKVINLALMGLFRSHITVALRSMKKYKFYAAVNILGLSLAISFVFLAYLFVQNELSYDQFHTKKDRTYRLYGFVLDEKTGAKLEGNHDGCTPIPLVTDLAAAIPAIKYHTRFGSVSGTVVMNQTPYQEVIAMADRDFFDMFDFPVLSGNKYGLDNLHGVILSQQRAEKYFNNESAIGKDLELILNDTSLTFTVEAVVDNRQNQSSLKFDILIPFERMRLCTAEENFKSYDTSFSEGWVTFDQPQNKSIESEFAKVFGDKMDMYSGKGMVGLQPLTDVHFDTQIQGMLPASNPMKVGILAGLAVLVLIIALVNFITLSIGHSMHRIREIGLRKTFGANRSGIRSQLILESLMVAMIASIVALALTFYFLPGFNDLIIGTLDRSVLTSHLGFVVLLILIISCLAGGIQAVVLVKFTPLNALRGTVSSYSKNSWGKQGVIVFQFAMSILLISGTLVIHQQMDFVQQKDLGFDSERLLEIDLHSSDDVVATKKLIERFQTEVASNPSIISVGAAMNGFRDPWTQMSFKQEDESLHEHFYNQVDKNYLQTMDIDVVMGHSFGEEASLLPSDIMVNETLVQKMGWQDPISKHLPGLDFEGSHRIIGVVKDFHFGSLHEKIQPLVLATDVSAVESGIFGISTYVWPPNLYHMVVKIGSGDLFDMTNYLESVWRKQNPNKEFTFRFVDEMLANKYAEEARWRKVINISAAFALVIAWLGLLGLTRLTMQRKVKEIGIRKVLGSSTLHVMRQLTMRYLILIIIAGIIITPIGWWLSRQWLDTFVYRFDLNWMTFLASALLALLLTALSVGIQSYRAAVANPVEALRSE